jgi:rhodanese-related sulfurtransferase
MRFFSDLKWSLLNLLIRFKFPSVHPISTLELAVWLEDENREKPLLLDARTSLEYVVSHLKNAYLSPSNLQELRELTQCSLSTPIVTYCSIGYRSAILAQQLQEIGYKQVFNLEGSLFIWFRENRPVYDNKQVVSYIHPYNLFWSFWL